MLSNLISGKKRVMKKIEIIIKSSFIFGDKFLKSSIKPMTKKIEPNIKIISKKLLLKIKSSKFIIFIIKDIKYKFIKNIKPPINDTGSL